VNQREFYEMSRKAWAFHRFDKNILIDISPFEIDSQNSSQVAFVLVILRYMRIQEETRFDIMDYARA